ncbi:MAG TPA: hypothetical protein VJZ00_14385 [Thermoanaerobaculia bacterium]|nr:hypothetical protein [Thermoanaerobaculia bacterium]
MKPLAGSLLLLLSATTALADSTQDLLMRQSSGTAMNPAAAPSHMLMTQRGDWMLMLHGLAFVTQVEQSGPRGADKLFSTNWLMGMASRPAAGGQLMFRGMLSLEPVTVGDKYPELFQTGETIDGHPIVDAQHPHDFFMELAVEYARPLTATTIGYVYAAPFGDPALGPVAYPHRASASELPQATLGHHLQDSTHIAGSVLTLGAQSGRFGYAVSGFHGQEPDENRWDIDTGAIDSWSARVTFDPTPNWSAQISTGHLTNPEPHEAGDVQRTTASVSYSSGRWNTSVIFGRSRVSSLLAESVMQFGNGNYVTGRAEIVDKDELFEHAHESHRIRALTLGYTRDVLQTRMLTAGVGANATVYAIPSELRDEYGKPHAFSFFVRLRGGEARAHSGHMHEH